MSSQPAIQTIWQFDALREHFTRVTFSSGEPQRFTLAPGVKRQVPQIAVYRGDLTFSYTKENGSWVLTVSLKK